MERVFVGLLALLGAGVIAVSASKNKPPISYRPPGPSPTPTQPPTAPPPAPPGCGSSHFVYNQCIACAISQPVYQDDCGNYAVGENQIDAGCEDWCGPVLGPPAPDWHPSTFWDPYANEYVTLPTCDIGVNYNPCNHQCDPNYYWPGNLGCESINLYFDQCFLGGFCNLIPSCPSGMVFNPYLKLCHDAPP